MIKGYTDLGDYSENDRILIIGRYVMAEPANGTEKPQVIGIALETREKAERYSKKLLRKFPTIKIIDIAPGLSRTAFYCVSRARTTSDNRVFPIIGSHVRLLLTKEPA